MSAIPAGLMLEYFPEGLLALDMDGAPCFVNGAALRVLRLAPAARAPEAWRRLCQICPDAVTALNSALGGKTALAEVVTWSAAFDVLFEPVPAEGGGGVLAMMRGCTALGGYPRRCAADAERRRNELLDALLYHSGESVWVIDADGVVLNGWARAEAPFLGYSPPELQMKSAFDFIHPADRAAARAFLASILTERGEVATDEFRCLHKNGSERLLEVTATNLLHLDAVRGIVLNSRDVTRAREAERTLRESEERFRTLFAASPTGIALSDAAGAYLEVNPAFCQMLGYTEDELFRMRVGDVVHHEDAASPQECGGSRIRVKERYITKDGGIVWASSAISLVRDDSGRPLYSIRVVENITERVIAEQALSESEHRYRELFEHAMDVVYTTDLAGRLTSVNVAAERLTGYSRSELIGRPFAELVDPAPPRMDPQFSAGAGGRSASPVEVHLRTRTGEIVPIELSATVLVRNGRPSEVLGIGRDIADRKNAEMALRASHDRLRELTAYLETAREQERTRIAREIHDELGQMLTVLSMDLEGIASICERSCPRAGDLLARIETASRHVRASIESVKEISSELRPGVLDHLGLGAAVEWQARQFERRSGIACSVEVPKETPTIDPDRSTAVFRILQETLTNIARHAGAHRVSIALSVSNEWLRLRVSDDGKGIDERAVHDPKSLGLLGMRERALLLGGSLKLRGAPGVGTTLTLRLPVKARRAAGRASAAAPGARAPSRQRKRILIADDHAIFRAGLRQVLAHQFAGAHIGEAANAEQVLQMAAAAPWDAILLDVSMPGKSGLEVLAALRDAGNPAPVLILSTYPEDEYKDVAKRAGASAYVSKGQSSSAIIEAVSEMLRPAPAGLRRGLE